ncbi:DUF2306 domain-containing protein [Microbacterium sp. NPDC064584]|uniref:DUF2306 domain-containing protein n=1 Tax=Microbacterium sp. NPDC064584 TaxID=3155817 RepID=UPI00343A65EC
MTRTITPPLARPRARRSREWLIPTSLLLLSAVPVLAGALRLTSLASGGDVTPENARFFALPLPVTLHIVGATTYLVLGAFQFVPSLRQRHPRYHRLAGRVLIPAGLVGAASGLWMTAVYDLPATDGGLLPLVRWVFGLAMIAALVLGLVSVRRREFAAHRAWMIRAYAIGIAAGTQVFTTLPWMLTGGLDATSKTLAMTLGWVLNLAVAEAIIRRATPRR